MKWLLAAVSAFFPFVSVASPVPCAYGEPGGAYRIEEDYKAADVIVEGKVTGKDSSDLRFEVQHTYKGNVAGEIKLVGQRPINTEINGFTLPEGSEFLLLLKASAGGPYSAVENFNSACPVAFEVKEDKVVFTETEKVPLHDLGVYLSRAKEFTKKLQ